MTKFKVSLALVACFLSAVMFFSCSKDSSGPDSSTLVVKLTDAPAAYTEINVDIQSVRVNLRGDSSGWVNLGTNAKVYNLLNFQNGVDTTLATGVIPTGTVQEVRFILGPNNTVVDNGVTYPLKLSSQDESGLKIKISRSITSAFDSLTIDFDAAQSIVKEVNGTYRLRPVLRLK